MNTSVLTWMCIVGLFLLIILIRGVFGVMHHIHSLRLNKIIASGSEREEFFIPGDDRREEDLPYYDD